MASPQLENGHVRIANELWDEVIRRDFTKRQKDILFLIWRLSYGCQRKTAYIPKLVYFELSGVRKNHIKSELLGMVYSKVVIWNMVEDTFEVNKDYDQWEVPPVKSFDDLKLAELIRLNLLESSQNGNKKVPETGTKKFPKQELLQGEENEKFPKQELSSSQNGNFFDGKVPEMGTPTPREPNQDKGSEPPKDIFKDSIKDSSTRSLKDSAAAATDFSYGRIYKIYEEHFTENGKVSQLEMEDLSDQFETYGGEWLLEAMREAVRAKVRTLAYINGVLNGFKTRGSCKKEKDSTPPAQPNSQESMFDEDDPIMRMMREEDRIRRGTAASAAAV